MTIYWQPDDASDPNSIDIWHVADDGTVNGPVTADVSNQEALSDAIGGVAPDSVRERIGSYIESTSPADDVWQQVVIDLLTLDYKRGTPP